MDQGQMFNAYDDPTFGESQEISIDRRQDDQSLKENSILDSVLGTINFDFIKPICVPCSVKHLRRDLREKVNRGWIINF
jgi:hypothetical protein